MEILKMLKLIGGKCKRAYIAIGLIFVPVLTFAATSDIGTLATHGSTEANSVKILVFDIILAVGAFLILCGIVTFFKKHVEHKFSKVAGCIFVGALCMMPRALITTADQSTLGATTNASANASQTFSAGG